MKAVILAGGLGTRLAEETSVKPKPMVEIGGMPILLHILKIYSYHGINEFIICGGYKSDVIKEFFNNYFLYKSDVTFDLSNNTNIFHDNNAEPWKVTVADTGEQTMTGGRIKRIKKYLQGEKEFCLTYGDGLSDIDIGKLIKFHNSHNGKATLTSIIPESRFGIIETKEGLVSNFLEKPNMGKNYINGGFFILSTDIIDDIKDDSSIFEQESLVNLSKEKELYAYEHKGFWHPMDTLRDKIKLNKLWDEGKAPWKIW
tara:strand:- start:6381 stop:7151 length:771 start_codon:yes stop_codon:yes gene_type:complete